MKDQSQNRVRMTAERHWERFDEACHGNAQQMAEIAEDAIEELLERDRERPILRADLYASLLADIMQVVREYGQTQQCRARISTALSKYIGPRR